MKHYGFPHLPGRTAVQAEHRLRDAVLAGPKRRAGEIKSRSVNKHARHGASQIRRAHSAVAREANFSIPARAIGLTPDRKSGADGRRRTPRRLERGGRARSNGEIAEPGECNVGRFDVERTRPQPPAANPMMGSIDLAAGWIIPPALEKAMLAGTGPAGVRCQFRSRSTKQEPRRSSMLEPNGPAATRRNPEKRRQQNNPKQSL